MNNINELHWYLSLTPQPIEPISPFGLFGRKPALTALVCSLIWVILTLVRFTSLDNMDSFSWVACGTLSDICISFATGLSLVQNMRVTRIPGLKLKIRIPYILKVIASISAALVTIMINLSLASILSSSSQSLSGSGSLHVIGFRTDALIIFVGIFISLAIALRRPQQLYRGGVL